MKTEKTEATLKKSRTPRLSRAEKQAKFRQEHYLVYNFEYCMSWYLASEHSMEDILEICSDMVTDEESTTKNVVVWLDREIVATAKRGDQGEAMVTDLSGPYPEWQRKLPN